MQGTLDARPIAIHRIRRREDDFFNLEDDSSSDDNDESVSDEENVLPFNKGDLDLKDDDLDELGEEILDFLDDDEDDSASLGVASNRYGVPSYFPVYISG